MSLRSGAGSQVGKGGLPPHSAQVCGQLKSGGKPPFPTSDSLRLSSPPMIRTAEC